jgi:DNA ligase-1
MKVFPTLYKRSNSKNNINEWFIEVDGDSFRTTTGFVGMKMFTGDWTKCTPKNTNKKNATTAEQQAIAEATSLWSKRKELGYWEDISDCDKEVFYQPMLAQDFDKRLDKVKYPLGSSYKLDGVRCTLKANGMWSRNGKKIISAPHIFRILEHLFEENPDLILDGELYTSDKEVDFNTIISCVRKTKPTMEDLAISRNFIEYHVYDLPYIDGIERGYEDRMVLLQQIVNRINDPKFVFVDYEIVNNESEVKIKLMEYIELGYEGQMLRVLDSLYENKRSNNLLKHKTFHDDEFEIIGYEEGIGKFSGKLATLSFKTQEGVQFNATVNGTMTYLEELFQIKDTLIGKQATVKYFEKTTDGSLRFPKVIAIDRFDLK